MSDYLEISFRTILRKYVTYEDPGSVIDNSEFETVRDTLVGLRSRHSVSCNAVDSKLLLFFGEQPLSATSLASREVRQNEHRA